MAHRGRVGWLVLAYLWLVACGGGASPASPGGAGGAGSSAGSKAPGNLPNLSSAGQSGQAGASGSGTEPEQCKFAALGPCVSSALDEAVACLQAGRVGVFSADRTACDFSEAGATAVFAEPVRRGSRGFQLDFDLRVADSSCLRFSEREAEAPFVERYELVTASHTVTYLHGFERRLECDGESHDYKASDLSMCPSSSMLELPMPEISEMAGAIAFEYARPGRISRVFICNAP